MGTKYLVSKQGGALQKTATVSTAQFGKQLVLQKQGGLGTPDKNQIMTLVKTSQGMVVAPLTKGAMSGSPQIVKTVSAQALGGKTIPQGATLVKLGGAKPQTIVMSKPGTILAAQAGSSNLIKTTAGDQGLVKMIVIGSGQLAQTPTRPIAIPATGSSKIVTLSPGSKIAIGSPTVPVILELVFSPLSQKTEAGVPIEASSCHHSMKPFLGKF